MTRLRSSPRASFASTVRPVVLFVRPDLGQEAAHRAEERGAVIRRREQNHRANDGKVLSAPSLNLLGQEVLDDEAAHAVAHQEDLIGRRLTIQKVGQAAGAFVDRRDPLGHAPFQEPRRVLEPDELKAGGDEIGILPEPRDEWFSARGAAGETMNEGDSDTRHRGSISVSVPLPAAGAMLLVSARLTTEPDKLLQRPRAANAERQSDFRLFRPARLESAWPCPPGRGDESSFPGGL